MREKIVFYLNGKKHSIGADKANQTLANYLRQEQGLTGTKVVCAEGDCGACTVLLARLQTSYNQKLEYTAFNSCIASLYSLDLAHIISVEGLGYNEVAKQMAQGNGAQCGYCTPGFVCAATAYVEKRKREKKNLTPKSICNALTGNLCRCTGYKSIVDSISSVQIANYENLDSIYPSNSIMQDLELYAQEEVLIENAEYEFYAPTTLDGALQFLAKKSAKIVAGATDVGVIINKTGQAPKRVLSLKNIKRLYQIESTAKEVEIGANVNLHTILEHLQDEFPEFCRLINVFASPQIKNKATLVGNVANGSPIGDSIPFLLVAGARIVLQSVKGRREVDLEKFYLGYKQFDMREEEMITSIIIPKMPDKVVKLYKVSARKDLDISAVTFAASMKIENKKIIDMRLAYGGVGPVVMRMPQVEQKVIVQNYEEAQNLVGQLVTPISDLRGSADFRKLVAANLLQKCISELKEDNYL